MTAAQVAELALSWLALLAAVAAVLSPRLSRLAWGASGLLFALWLTLMAPPGLGSVLAVGVLAAIFLEGEGELAQPDFARTTRRLGLLVAGIAAAVLLMVRVAEVDPGDAPYVFPPLAGSIVSLTALYAAVEPAEIHRAARLLLVLAAVGWTIASGGTQAAPTVLAAVALPVLAVAAKVTSSPESPQPGEPEP